MPPIESLRVCRECNQPIDTDASNAVYLVQFDAYVHRRCFKDKPVSTARPESEAAAYCIGCGFALYKTSKLVRVHGAAFHPECAERFILTAKGSLSGFKAEPTGTEVAQAKAHSAEVKCAWCGGAAVGLFDSKVESMPVNLCKACAALDGADESATLYGLFYRSRSEAERLREALRLILASGVSCEDDCPGVQEAAFGYQHDPFCHIYIAREALGGPDVLEGFPAQPSA